MRLNIFRKARYFIKNNQVKITSVGEHSMSFLVGNCRVISKYQNHKLIWLCDCKADTNNYLCSHKIAAQTYLNNLSEEMFMGYVNSGLKEVEDIEIAESKQIGLPHLSTAQKLVLRQMVNFRCQDCKKHEDEVGKLEPHRITRGADGGLYIPQNIKMLCKECHDKYDY